MIYGMCEYASLRGCIAEVTMISAAAGHPWEQIGMRMSTGQLSVSGMKAIEARI